MPLTPAERTGLENLKLKIDAASVRIEGEKLLIEDQRAVLSSNIEDKSRQLNQLTNAKEAVQTLLDIDAGGIL